VKHCAVAKKSVERISATSLQLVAVNEFRTSPTLYFLIQFLSDVSYFRWKTPGILKMIVYLLLVGVFSFVILFLIEFKVFEMINYSLRTINRTITKALFNDHKDNSTVFKDKEISDSDVRIEKEKIKELQRADYAKYNLVMKDLTKYYKNFLAVDQLCIGVKRFECFGLLGTNGAGKTSTFKMLTGDLRISSGEAWVQGISIKTNMKEVHKHIGYCPQFEALIDELTGRETLRFFALSRGIPKTKLQIVIKKLASAFNFTKHLDKKVKAYSGGNKRKLSVSVALLGNPAIIYLDEPTTGKS
jgi:ATP-binding cassette, subfamily A (ABC1), member 3